MFILLIAITFCLFGRSESIWENQGVGTIRQQRKNGQRNRRDCSSHVIRCHEEERHSFANA